MPGVLVIEALAQAGGLLTQLSPAPARRPQADKLFYLVKIDNARFTSMVVPGDRLELEVKLKRTIRNMAHVRRRRPRRRQDRSPAPRSSAPR